MRFSALNDKVKKLKQGSLPAGKNFTSETLCNDTVLNFKIKSKEINSKSLTKKINKIYNKIKEGRIKIEVNSNIKYSFLFNLILDKLNINLDNLPSSDENLHYSFVLGIFILSLICLLSYINVLGYSIATILIKRDNIFQEKYPKIYKILNYFLKSSLIFFLFEAILCLLILIFIVIISLLEINSSSLFPLFSFILILK